jgi:hypothetical protein
VPKVHVDDSDGDSFDECAGQQSEALSPTPHEAGRAGADSRKIVTIRRDQNVTNGAGT